MDIYIIIQVMKYKKFDAIQFLLKPLSFIKRFDWYNSQSQGKNIEWKTYVTFKNFKSVKPKNITCCNFKIYWSNIIYLIKQCLWSIKGLQSDQSLAIILWNCVPYSWKSSKGKLRKKCPYSELLWSVGAMKR